MRNYKEELVKLFLAYNIKEYTIDYYSKIFGNIDVKFLYDGIECQLVSDRGEILLNGKTIYNSSCLEREISTIDVIINEIKNIIKK